MIAVLSRNAVIRGLGGVNSMLYINVVLVAAFVIGVTQGYDVSWVMLLGALLVIGALVANNLYSRRLSAPASSMMIIRQAC